MTAPPAVAYRLTGMPSSGGDKIRAVTATATRVDRIESVFTADGYRNVWLPEPPDSAVTARLRGFLEVARSAGLAFAEAWPQAVEATLASAGGPQWREVFEDTRWAWEDAYTGADAPPGWVGMLSEGGVSGNAPSCARNYKPACPWDRVRRATTRLRPTNRQEPTMPATTTATTDTTAAAPATRQPKDPEAAALATAARDIARAAGLKSAYSSGEGREVLDRFTVERTRGVLAITKDGGEPQKIKLTVLRAFVAGEKDDDTRDAAKLMAELAQGMKGMLYGRKIAAFLVAASA